MSIMDAKLGFTVTGEHKNGTKIRLSIVKFIRHLSLFLKDILFTEPILFFITRQMRARMKWCSDASGSVIASDLFPTTNLYFHIMYK